MPEDEKWSSDVDRHKLRYDISEVAPYINWAYFYYAWQVGEREEKRRLRREAEGVMERLEGRYHTHAVFAIGDANSDGDDIVFCGKRLPMLRQQRAAAEGEPNLCLADYLKPVGKGLDTMGVFATTVDIGLEKDFLRDDYKRMMAQLIADRLAEATAEKMHEEVRKTYWGYSADERLSIEEMQEEKFRGIRPAVGYPSMPDTSINFVIDDIIDMGSIGIRLTESGAMKPHASVSGLMIAHPGAHYFTLGKIGDDQLRDYALRRGMPVELARRFLEAVLR